MQYLMVIAGIFGAELGVKGYIEKNVAWGETRKILGGMACIRKHHNRGAFLNAGQGRRGLVAALSLVLTLFMTIVFIFTWGKAGRGTLKWGLSLLLGGAYSNTYDRLVRKYVVDYVSFPLPFGLDKVIFNIGDFGIIVGTMLYITGGWGEIIS